jgi:hypothetical protein
MVRAGGVGSRGVGKRERAEEKGKEKDDDLEGKTKGAVIAASSLFVGLKTTRGLRSCLCSAESTAAVAVSAAGVPGSFATGAELSTGVLGGLEPLRGGCQQGGLPLLLLPCPVGRRLAVLDNREGGRGVLHCRSDG